MRSQVSDRFISFARRHGPPGILTSLPLGKVEECPFNSTDIADLEQEVIENLSLRGLHLERGEGDCIDVPIDFRFIDLLLRASQHPEMALGSFAKGVRVGPGTRLPRLPALYAKKTKWRLPEQADPTDSSEEQSSLETIWRRNYASPAELPDKVIDVLEDQSRRIQVLKLERTRSATAPSTPGRCLFRDQQESKTARDAHGACSVRWHERVRSERTDEDS